MPSQQHQNLVALFRNRPDMAFELLRDVFSVPVTVPTRLQAVEATLSEVDPAEYSADLVLAGDDGPVVILEAQLRPDEDKRWTWPHYLTGVRVRLRRGVHLLVVTPSQATAEWARTPLQMGHTGFDLEPYVLGPETVPEITDPSQAIALPELAVLSAIVHGRSRSLKKAQAVGHSALVAAGSLDEERARLYIDLVLSALSRAARAILEKMIMEKPHEYQSDFARRYIALGRQEGIEKGIEKGERQGLAHALLAILSARSIKVDRAARQRIEGCDDSEQLQRWLVRAATATSLDEVWAEG